MRTTLPETLALSELRNLRRYAFCVCGNRALGDIAVEAALNSLVRDIRAAAGQSVSRLDLYRKVNESVKANGHRGAIRASVVAGGVHSGLLKLPLPQREIVVLHAVIRLPFGDVAAVMGIAEAAARRLYADALFTIQPRPASVLIIEDEALIARELSQIVTRLGIPVAGTAKNKSEALRIAGTSRPRLILADYALKQGETGIEVVRAIREELDADVIYVTAHPEVVTTQLETSSDMVISKPFNSRSIERALQSLMAA
jgi:CheY-like chemotaxis protein